MFTRKKVLVSKVEATALTEANLTLSASSSSSSSCGSWSLSAHTSPPPRHLRTLLTSLTCNFSGFACVAQKTLVMVLLCCRYSKKSFRHEGIKHYCEKSKSRSFRMDHIPLRWEKFCFTNCFSFVI